MCQTESIFYFIFVNWPISLYWKRELIFSIFKNNIIPLAAFHLLQILWCSKGEGFGVESQAILWGAWGGGMVEGEGSSLCGARVSFS